MDMIRKKQEEEMKRKQEEFLKQQQEELRKQQLEIQREKEEMERKREALERETALQLQVCPQCLKWVLIMLFCTYVHMEGLAQKCDYMGFYTCLDPLFPTP